MAANDISGKFQGLKINHNQDINILLLGETGVGKSTFINSIANYLHFKSFKKAAKAEDLLILIPSLITITNENFEQVTLTVGSDNNEFQEIGEAATQDVKTYVFPIGEGKTRLRLIDSPGMADPRGIDQDDTNCENILAYLSQLKELHAICFLMKPTTTRITVMFEYCVKQILSRLEKSASKNIIFIFTNTRGSNYSPGETLPCLRAVIDGIKAKPPHVAIPLKDNIFSLDNEAFRFLVALKNNIQFSDDVKQRFIESWDNSSRECWRLISYIVGDASHDALKPHQLENTFSINEARRIIVQLSQPLADISQLIYDNIRILEKHQRNLKMDNQSLDQLKNKLYIPIIRLQVTELTQPVTVCTSPQCAKLVQVGEAQKWHYHQRCHDPCYLTNVTKEIIGDVNLMNCAAMSGRTCQKCRCDFSVHMHVYYLSKTVDDKAVDEDVKKHIVRQEEAVAESRRLMTEIDRRKRELEQEREVIIQSTAQFAHFLQHNAISPFNDAYKAYIEYLISRERSLGRNGDVEVIHNLEQLMGRYQEIKAAFDSSLNLNQQVGLDSNLVTPQSVMNRIKQLYRLKHNGQKIQELLTKQKHSRNYEYDKSCEYVHPKTSDYFSQSEKTSKTDKRKKGKSDGEMKKDKSGKSDHEMKKDKKKDDDRRGKSDNEMKKDKKRSDTDDDRQRPGYNRNYQNYQRTRSYDREPPPPYSGPVHHNPPPRNQRPTHYNNKDRNFVVKVELSQPMEPRRGNMHGGAPPPRPDPYYNPPHNTYPYQDPNFQQRPPQDPYYPPQNPYYGPPSGPHYGPPSGPHYAPPPGPHYAPPSGPHYHPPPGPHYSPPSGSYQGQHSVRGSQQQYQQSQFSGPGHQRGAYQKHNYGNRGRGHYKQGGGDRRSNSKPRPGKDKKNSKKRSSSSSSDSSD